MFILAHSSRIQFIMEEARRQEKYEVAGHTASTFRKQIGECGYSPPFSFSFSFRLPTHGMLPLTHGMLPPTFNMDIPTSTKLT